MAEKQKYSKKAKASAAEAITLHPVVSALPCSFVVSKPHNSGELTHLSI